MRSRWRWLRSPLPRMALTVRVSAVVSDAARGSTKSGVRMLASNTRAFATDLARICQAVKTLMPWMS
eukprot:3629742-Alexandrium_andersonii.AAC.1